MSGDDLPDGWRILPLGELADLALGKMLDKAKHGARVAQPYLRNINVQWDRIDTHDLNEMPFESRELERFAVREGDLLVCEGGEPGRCAVWDGRVPNIKYQKALHRVRPNGGLNSRFLLHHLRLDAQRGVLDDYFTGTTIKHLTASSLARYPVRHPGPAEQSRIVAHLDTCFDRTKRAKAVLDDVPALVDRLRQSILAAAFRGDLTADWRAENPDVEPASELLKRIRIERRRRWEEAELAKMIAKGKAPKDDRWKAKYEEPEPVDESGLPELPEGWCWTTVETAGDVHLGRQLAPQYMTGRGTRPYLRVANIKDDRIDFSDVKRMDFDEQEFAHYALRRNDILLSEGQSPELLGQSAIYRGGVEELCFQKTLHRFRRYESAPSAEFFQLLFRHYVRSGMFRSVASVTVNIAHLTLVRLKPLPIPLPPAAEAEEIAKRCAAVLGYARTAQQNVVAVRRELASVEAAVLGGAFASATDFAES